MEDKENVYSHTIALNMSSYSKPEIIENSMDDWVGYGEDNDYFKYLADRFNGSPTNNAIITATAMMIYGLGLDCRDKLKDMEGWLEVVGMFDADLLRRTALDLKLYGNFCWQVLSTTEDNVKSIVAVKHVPVQNIRAGKAKDGQVSTYYYSDDWQKYKDDAYKPKPIPAFGHGKKLELLYVRLQSPDTFYYSPPDYQGGVQYAELEEEIANFHINNIHNGLTPSMIINFNNGIPAPEKRDELRKDIERRLGGTKNAGKFILNFAQSREKSPEIKALPLSQADKQYQFLSTESQEKILVSHRVTSPMLMGIKNKTGLGNNADELRTGYMLYDSTVVRPFQGYILDAIERVINVMGMSFDMFFKPLQPIEDAQPKGGQAELSLGEYGCKKDMTTEESRLLLEQLKAKAEYIDAELYEEIEEHEVQGSIEDEAGAVMAESSRLMKLTTAYASPEDGSEAGDTGLYKIRYRYSPQRTSTNSRDFCVQMVADAKEGAVYRLEDINEMSMDGVNGQFAPKGESRYSIWKYKGGVNCHHRWTRVVFFRKRDSKGRFLPPSTSSSMDNDKQSTVTDARAAGVPRKKLRPKDFGTAATAPINMPNQGRKK